MYNTLIKVESSTIPRSWGFCTFRNLDKLGKVDKLTLYQSGRESDARREK